jgi:hypothetical protein
MGHRISRAFVPSAGGHYSWSRGEIRAICRQEAEDAAIARSC